ncbi:stearoyl-CoA 9-desaturase [Pseudonocardia sp. HH130630-07]|nr:stearoyl-CoA 9-desaturase [Pseudonocardia sp. HH130630-07]
MTSPLLPEDFLTLVDPLWSTTSLRGRVVARRRETGRAVSVAIEPGRAWAGHRAGQYVGLAVEVDGVRHRRTYSLSSPEGAEHLTVTVQEVPDGVVSTRLVRNLPIGTIVELDQAAGEFTLPDPLPEKLLFVTAGSGITPVMAMLRTLDRAAAMPDVVLVHAARSPEDTIFAGELTALAARHPSLRVVLRHSGVTGRLDPGGVDRTVPDRADRAVYACGPAGLLDALDEAWDGVRVERFRPAGRASVEGTGGVVELGGTRVEVEPGRSLLDAGEAAGKLMPSGCRMGICFGCVLPLREGRVRDLRTGEEHGEPGDLVQTCVNSACGPARIDLP